MKTIRSIIVLAALALVISLLTLPLLAKGIAQLLDNSLQAERLDLRPIPVPVPAPPLAANQPAVSATPFPSLLATGPLPQPIPVPTPAAFATPPVPSLAERQMPESSTAVTVQIANRQDILTMTLVAIMLLNLVWLHRLPSLHSLTKENPC
jgi:hypothetical protein